MPAKADTQIWIPASAGMSGQACDGGEMVLRSLIVMASLWVLFATPAAAQNPASPLPQPGFASPGAPPPRHAGGRITIYPGRLLYRRCTDWYELQHRPSGTVLYPQMRCWWVRG